MHSKLYIPARSAATAVHRRHHPGVRRAGPNPRCRCSNSTTASARNSRTGDNEVIILPLAGGGTVECDGETFDLTAARSVFDGPVDLVYVGIGQTYVIDGEGRFALCGARAQHVVPVPPRRGGRRLRRTARRGQLQPPGAQLRHRRRLRSRLADRLRGHHPRRQLVELSGHKHDENTRTESELEEIYYFEIAARPDGSRGFGYHRVYGTPDRPIEVLEEVRTGDVVLVPHGYHGPSIAAPGYHMYYLNVMAGPGDERAWKIFDDPAHAWLRGTWDDQNVDPRLPLHSPTRSLTVVSTAPKRAEKIANAEGDRPPHRRAGDHSVPRQPVRRARRRTHQVLRRLLRHLRPRQRRRARSGAAAGRDRRRRVRHRARCRTCSAATSRRWCTAPSRTPGRRTGCRPGRSPPASDPARPTC